jgi:hypothetical protein
MSDLMTTAPGPTGGGPSHDLLSLLRLVCSGLPPEEISARLGTVQLPAEAGDPAHIEPTRYASLRAIEYLPWTEDDFGIVELLPADPDAWRLIEIEAMLGPFNPVVSPDSHVQRLGAEFEDSSLPAWAAVVLDLAPSSPANDGRVESITIRTEPPEREDD